jgi:pimeloyl-ACP methyl ester carboxylesterase
LQGFSNTFSASPTYNNISIDGLNIFYREAGARDKPTIVLLHGYPASSHMYRDLMNELSDQFHLIAPDYPGFGNSETPAIDKFEYSFDRLAEITEHFLQALGLNRFSLYVQDYGAPVGFRIASQHPDWIQALIVQNGNAYEEGLTPAWQAFRDLWSDRSEATEAPVRGFLTRDTTVFFYTAGTRSAQNINPDNWNLDQSFLDRPENAAAQMELFYNYRANLDRYPQWHEYFRTHQPPTLIVWGKNDPFFGPEGANAFKRDLKNAEVHLLDTGHFALDEEGEAIASHIRRFLPANITF